VVRGYVLPMGFSSERHDLMSQESYGREVDRLRAAGCCGFCRKREGKKFDYTYQANPGRSFGKKDEFWINPSWAIDPDGSIGNPAVV